MHELSLASGILDTVGRLASKASAVREVHVTVGRLAGVSVDALEFGFAAIAQARGFTGARLVVRTPRARARCTGCGAERDAGDDLALLPCEACGCLVRTIVSGTELTLDSIEVED